jgi:Fe-S-cluster containining protein
MRGHEDIESIYRDAEASLPARDCRRTTRCCRFAETGREPYVTRAEVDYLFAVLRAQGRKLPLPRTDGACPFLDRDEKTCTVYEGRPFGCRTNFCREAGGAVTAQEMKASIDRLNALDETLGGEGPRPLTRVLSDVARAGVPRAKRRWIPKHQMKRD